MLCRIYWSTVRLVRKGGLGRGYLRRPPSCRALTRPIAPSMGSLLRPVVRRRKRSCISFWAAIFGTFLTFECLLMALNEA
jgi:hypothetical protein